MKPFTADDLYLHRKITAAHSVAGLDMVAAAVRSVDRKDNRYTCAIWAFAADGSQARQLTPRTGLDESPRWSPDGARLAFLSDRAGGAPQVHVLPREGGEAHAVGDFDKGAVQLRWMPDSKTLLVTAAVAVDPDLRGHRGAADTGRQDDAAEVCWRLPYKSDGVGYLLQREIHLFSLPATGGPARRLTDGAFDVSGYEASPNGRHVAYSRTRDGRHAHCTDLWACDADGTRHRRLTRELAMVLQPAWSPDGRWIAFAGARKEGDSELRLWLLEFASGELRELVADMEVADGESLHWPSDDHLVLVRAHRGRHEIVRVPLAGGEPTVLVGGDRQIGAFCCAGDRFFFSVETPVLPSELCMSSHDGSGERRLSQLNPWWDERTPLELEPRSFRVPDGDGATETIEGWLLRAKGNGRPSPLLDDAHGGPAAYALLDYDTNVYWHVLCSHGWGVLMLNPVGSSSFGGAFCARLSGHWGELDMPQHAAAIRQLQAEGVCDDRIALAGKSYGGYLTAWGVGHSSMFRAAVVMAPVGNIETHYGTSDGGYYADPVYLATAPAFDRSKARELSPLQFIERARTPTLFMQGKDDERCPKCQSEELFVSMHRASDTPAELVLYPGEGHLFLSEGKPRARADASQRIVEWLMRHTAQPPAGHPVPGAAAQKEEHTSSAG